MRAGAHKATLKLGQARQTEPPMHDLIILFHSLRYLAMRSRRALFGSSFLCPTPKFLRGAHRGILGSGEKQREQKSASRSTSSHPAGLRYPSASNAPLYCSRPTRAFRRDLLLAVCLPRCGWPVSAPHSPRAQIRHLSVRQPVRNEGGGTLGGLSASGF